MSEEGRRLVKKVEERRRAAGLTQAEVAAGCGMTQGHYSKLLHGRPAGTRCLRSIKAWLKQPAASVRRDDPLADGSAQRLAASIRRDIGRLSAMIGVDGAARAGRGARRNGGS